jgi:PAS domain S-box-containing protein
MSPIADAEPLSIQSRLESFLDEPEEVGLLRLTRLVEHLFRVPIAYIALFGPDLAVVRRIGSGTEYSEYLKTLPLAPILAAPTVWPNPSGVSAPGFMCGAVKFVAAVPLRSADGLDLGLLVIADVVPRTDFTERDHDALAELAGVLAGKMDLRMTALQAQESELLLKEAECRFRNIADSTAALIIYSDIEGSGSFVNKTWLEFTGRSMEEELGEGFEDSFHPDYRESVMQVYWQAFQERRTFTVEFPMRRHDGEYRWMRACSTPRFVGDGQCVGYVGTLVDFTEQRSAILALKKQRRCTDAVAEAANVLYLILDREGRIEQASALCTGASIGDTGEMSGRFIWEVWNGTAAGTALVRDAIRTSVCDRVTVKTPISYSAKVGEGVAELMWTFTPILSDRDEVIALTATAIEPGTKYRI